MPKSSNTADRRVVRTKRALREAMLELIKEKHYDSITVQNIIDRADVGRSTFYTHFRDKEDLFRGDWEGLLTHFVRGFRWKELPAGPLVPIEFLFQHLKDFHPLYRGIVRSGKADQVLGYGTRFVSERIAEELRNSDLMKADSLVPAPLLANYLSTEIFSTLRWWLDENMPYSPERMEKIFQTMVVPGIVQSLDARVEKN